MTKEKKKRKKNLISDRDKLFFADVSSDVFEVHRSRFLKVEDLAPLEFSLNCGGEFLEFARAGFGSLGFLRFAGKVSSLLRHLSPSL